MPHLKHVPGVLSTEEVFRWLAGNATERLDLIVQYWQLVASPENPLSGDYGYSSEEMKTFGADAGAGVYRAMEDAADRNVSVRIVQHSGVYPDYCNESSKLANGRPNVENVTLLFDDWWGSGIVHAKVWIADGKDMYIGSANNDWKSLTQVKEVGVYLVDCHPIAKKVEVYFQNLMKLSSLNSSTYSKRIWDSVWQVHRNVPCWSHFVNARDRCRSPLPGLVETPHVIGYPALANPYMFDLPMDMPGYNHNICGNHRSYVSFSPPELSFGKFQSDEQAWSDTIKSAHYEGTVRISTMDWLGQSQYVKQPIYWSSLASAISEVVFSKHAKVKILVAYWAHNIDSTDQYLKSLLYTNTLCESSRYNRCTGKVEIKYYKVPGFNMTGAAVNKGQKTANIYPAYSRVNHGKYAVSDVRAHIGTSNLLWDYFFTTAGVSFGTYHPAIVSQLQEIFDADWDSPYSVPVEPLVRPWRTEK
ncbi:Phospholipase D Z [Nymphaea thermarum]|nr:Phospholipase D Z [Nymphaea thermarum]